MEKKQYSMQLLLFWREHKNKGCSQVNGRWLNFNLTMTILSGYAIGQSISAGSLYIYG